MFRIVAAAMWLGLIIPPRAPAIAAQPPAPTPAETAAALLSARGAEYVALRDTLLGEPSADCDVTLAALRAEGSYAALNLADAIGVRRDHPDWAADFDARLQTAWDTAPRDAAGKPRPGIVYQPADAPRFLSLACEHVLMRTDSPPQLRWQVANMLRPDFAADPAGVVGLMALLEAAGQPGSAFDLLGGHAVEWARITGDQRIPAALAVGYSRFREAYPDSTGHVHRALYSLPELGTPAALEALRAMVASERARMMAAGHAPWDDLDAIAAFQAASQERTRRESEARKQRVNLSPDTRAALEAEVAQARARRLRRTHWEFITQALARAEAAQNNGE